MIGSYGPMRAMREKLRAASRRGLVAAVDLGGARAAVAVLAIDAQRLARAEAEGRQHDAFGAVRVVGFGRESCGGVKGGAIADMAETARALRLALERAEKMAGERVDHALALAPAPRCESFDADGEAALEGLEVDPRDIARAVHDARIPLPPDRAVLHAQPVNYRLDERDGLRDPRGMAGSVLQAHLHILTAPQTGLRDLAACLRAADLDLAGVVSAPYAAGLAALVEEARGRGAACVDLGASTTGVSIFLRGKMVFADGARLGGDHVTNDISAGLAMSQEAAERLKIVSGGAVATGVDDRDMLAIPGENGAHRRVSRAALIGVIRPRLEEILETARDRLRAAHFDDLPAPSVALTGGASQLPGLEEIARRVFGRRAHLAPVLRVAGLPPNAATPAFAALAGLCAYAARPEDELWDHDAPLAPNGRGRFLRSIKWIAENW